MNKLCHKFSTLLFLKSVFIYLYIIVFSNLNSIFFLNYESNKCFKGVRIIFFLISFFDNTE